MVGRVDLLHLDLRVDVAVVQEIYVRFFHLETYSVMFFFVLKEVGKLDINSWNVSYLWYAIWM